MYPYNVSGNFTSVMDLMSNMNNAVSGMMGISLLIVIYAVLTLTMMAIGSSVAKSLFSSSVVTVILATLLMAGSVIGYWVWLTMISFMVIIVIAIILFNRISGE